MTVECEDLTLEGKVVLLIGANGSGKTTLLKSMGKLLNYQGQISKASSFSYLEEMRAYPKTMRVKDYLDSMIQQSSDGCRVRMQMLIKLFALDAVLFRTLEDCSKGMRQKVNLVQAFMHKRDVYLLDEPLSGLDLNTTRKFLAYVKLLDAKVVCASHEVGAFEVLKPQKVYL